ncbi:hypothetical protein [Synechocystis sp. LKSZ1]|uniref:hypothetical protein n=1 Tax=Synechocystis sp. LKSZ1 TaxID=3144951 RepID=UPI00336BB231
MNRRSLALLVISVVLMVDTSSASATRWGVGESPSDGAGATEHRCVAVLEVQAGEAQERRFSPPNLDLKLAALALGESEEGLNGVPLYVETLIYNEGRVEVIRSWLHHHVCQ